MKNALFDLVTILVLSLLMLSCTSKSDDTGSETNADVIKYYAGKNYQLIALETQIRYGNQLYQWKKGFRPNWVGNRYERYVTMDMKEVFDTTATFQIIDHGANLEKVKMNESIGFSEVYHAFDFVKMNAANRSTHTFFKGIYAVKKEGEFSNESASILYFPLIFPVKYRLKFSHDTLDVIYENTKSALGAESLAIRLKLSN